VPAYAARDELHVDASPSGPKAVRAAGVAASSRQVFDMRFGGLSHEAIIETAATGRKRNSCIACMRQANDGTCRRRTSLGLPTPSRKARASAWRQTAPSFAAQGALPMPEGRVADFRVV